MTATIDEALERFTLIQGAGSPNDNTACAMTALSWVAGEAWSDRPKCAHPLLSTWAIQANDAKGTTAEQRAEIVRAGETGIIDTWWVPVQVVLWALTQAPKTDSAVERVLSVERTISTWKKTEPKARPNLAGANLAGANLADANLARADLAGANLARAYLADANLAGANLADAYLADANLADADLARAYLARAYLAGADLAGANLARADLAGANLARAYLAGANLARAYLADANLAGANLAGATYSQLTLWPADFDPKAAGAVDLTPIPEALST